MFLSGLLLLLLKNTLNGRVVLRVGLAKDWTGNRGNYNLTMASSCGGGVVVPDDGRLSLPDYLLWCWCWRQMFLGLELNWIGSDCRRQTIVKQRLVDGHSYNTYYFRIVRGP